MSLRSHFDDLEIPTLNSIYKCEVVNLQEYGAFLKIPGYRKNGLLHKQQISKNVVDNVNQVLAKGDEVWCKIIAVGSPDEPKISLSMKVVDQGSGKDLDPNGVQAALDEQYRREHNPRGRNKIILEAVFNTVCKKCGTKGHLSQDCYNLPGSTSYELLDEDSDDVQVRPLPNLKESRTEVETKKVDLPRRGEKRKHKKHKKEKKHKKSKSNEKTRK